MPSSISSRNTPGGSASRNQQAPPTIDMQPVPSAPGSFAPGNATFNPQYGAQFAGAQLPGFWSGLNQSANTFDQIGNLGYGGFFSGPGWPGNAYNNADRDLTNAGSNEQLDQMRGFISGNQGFWPAQAGNLTHLAQYGLPGTQQLQQEQQSLAGLGGGLLGGQGGYGVSDLLSQIFSQGLPNQSGVEQMFGQQNQLGQGAQQSALNQFQGLQGQGGPGQQQAMQAVMSLLGGGGQGPGQAQAMQALLGMLGGQTQQQGQAGNIFGQLSQGQPLTQQQAQGQFTGMMGNQPQSQQAAQGIFQGLAGNNPQAQQQAQGMLSGLAGFTPGVQGTASNALNSLISGSGLSPEFVAAQRRQVLDPSREALLGNLNARAGGGDINSPVYQELLRRQESDFNDSLVRSGQANLGNYIGQGLQAGGQQFGQQAGVAGQLAGLGGQQFGQQAGIGQALAGLGGQQFGQQFDIGQALAGLGGQQFGQQRGVGQDLASLGGQQFGQGLGAAQALGGLGQNQFGNQLGAAQALGNMGQQQFGNQFDIGQALAGMGQQGIGNALQAFNTVPNSLAPFASMGANLGSNLMNQSLDRFNSGNQLGLQGMQATQNMALDPMQFLQNSQFGSADRSQQMLNTLLNSGLNYQGLMQQYGLGQQGMQSDILRSILSGEYSNEQARMQNQQANRGMWGNILGGAVGALPAILAPFTGGASLLGYLGAGAGAAAGAFGGSGTGGYQGTGT